MFRDAGVWQDTILLVTAGHFSDGSLTRRTLPVLTPETTDSLRGGAYPTRA